MPPGLLSPAAKLVLYTSMDQNKLALSVVKVSGSRGENAGMSQEEVQSSAWAAD